MSRSRDRVTAAVGVVVTLALLVRLIGLGSRPFHWDEARVGYWTLRFAETGVYEYRPVAGGPFLYVVGRWLLTVLPATDLVARIPVALVGGALPAAALLFRGRLRDDETVAVAVVLAFAPVLLYYSRFLRGDVPLAAAALVAVGCAVRWVDTDGRRWLYAAAAAAAVGAGSSGFALATLALVVAAGFVTVDHRRVAGEGESARVALGEGGRWVVDRATPIARALFVFLGTWALLFTPRGWGLLVNPLTFARRTYWAPLDAFYGVFVGGREGTQFLPYVTDALSTTVSTGGLLLAVAFLGFLADRYGALPCTRDRDGPRPLVQFTSMWAGLGLIGYPVVAITVAPWTLVHVFVPLAIPAGVGLAALARYGRRSVAAGDAARATAALLVLLAVGAHAGVVVAEDAYGPQTAGNSLAQFAQPSDDLEPLVADMEQALADSDDPRIVYVGDRFYLPDESTADQPPISPESARDAWGERLPLPWYVERTGAETGSVVNADRMEGSPAVVITDPGNAAAVDSRLSGYERRELRLGLWNRKVVVFLEN
ncbi:flippase activity-associated protein Agl23 [Haloparvum sp. AD34]